MDRETKKAAVVRNELGRLFAQVAGEKAATYGPGEEPNRKYSVEAEREDDGTEFIQDFDDVDDLIAWIESEIDR